MVLVSSIVVSFLIALVRGGKIALLTVLRFKGLHFLAAAILLRVVLTLYPLQSVLIESAVGQLKYGGLIYIVSLVLTLLALLSNIQLPGFKALTAGMALNFLVIAANFGQMPGALDKIVAAGYTGENPGRWSNFTVMNDNTALWFLGDNFLVGRPWPLPSVISLGDLVIIVGAFWFFQKALVPSRE